jgi:pyruvate/2-oxoglutarate/acetoin dehydrogenase E1 component
MVYIGEDVEHGGYYLVTEGLKAKYPLRVRDFPPDETSLLGAGIGFSQAGLLPVVEIPYAK